MVHGGFPWLCSAHLDEHRRKQESGVGVEGQRGLQAALRPWLWTLVLDTAPSGITCRVSLSKQLPQGALGLRVREKGSGLSALKDTHLCPAPELPVVCWEAQDLLWE